jgi:hypothetical protein
MILPSQILSARKVAKILVVNQSLSLARRILAGQHG